MSDYVEKLKAARREREGETMGGSSETPSASGSSENSFAEFRDMLKEAYLNHSYPSVHVATRYFIGLSLTEEQNDIWDKVMNPKKNDKQ